MKELLEELKKIDPACYDEIARGLEQVDIEYEDDIIQGACQRAVTARRWGMRLELPDSTEDPGIYAFICIGAQCLEAFYADTPAKAILAAYIAAREFQP